MAVIRVPKPPKSAYNPQRPAGTLLQNQVRHLEWAVRPAAERTEDAFRIKPPKSEREAATRIQKLTVELERQAKTRKRGLAKRPSTRKPRATARKKKS
jgi:hypothetical protein